MKLSPLMLVTALLLTFTMALVALVYERFHEYYQGSAINLLMIALALFVTFLINYGVLVILFKSYDKKQIKIISETFPNYFVEENPISLQELGEKFSDIQHDADAKVEVMQEMDKYRKEYLGNVSHELKTPLFSIQGYVETLMDGGVENLNIRDKYLDRISKSVDRILNIVQDLDMISKLESGQISLSYSRFDLNALVREVFDLLDLEAQKISAKFTLFTPQSTVWVYADRKQISQVLVNLLANAVYYCNREKASINVEINLLGSEAIVKVSDNGMGIKPESLARIFERFYRVDSARSRKEGGSGLGLAIVKHIMEAHHKTIDVQSVYLEGTQFIFRLDLTP
ncbi:cell wall metabolism sensor histidine kinase WalK [Elizabethkingia sp. JS20170427COW]|uniref:sensor histidine kinase n=1 Tax=Elizabethkingia sp. JS20170427COW TaxID=2583851 RepID=UPI001110C8C3|nr:GHKL domain-containing protein [Elizabethkingia sp. JS20170427COW]